MIEALITIALLLYFAAYFVAKHGKQYFLAHIPIAIIAFIMDMYATFLMYKLPDTENVSWIVGVHTTLTLIAIALFFVQAFLGLRRMRKYHILFAKKIFLPMWIVSYCSGFLFFLI